MREKLFPAEVTSDCPCIMLTGKSLLQVEQHQGLLSYQEDQITLKTSLGLLKLRGREMHFRHYSAREATISGDIEGITLSGGKAT